MNVFVFPGQGAQFAGMGKELYSKSKSSKNLFDKADEILGFSLSEIMFEGSDEDLKKTKVTQPAIFVHSIAKLLELKSNNKPDFVAGHSLGEFSALVANKTIEFEDGLKLVSARANAMQKACENNHGSMAAILGLDDKIIINECEKFDKYVVAANLNCPGQVVISGKTEAVEEICTLFNSMGAKRCIKLNVSGAFHSKLMHDAKKELKEFINSIQFNKPICPIFQNVNAKAVVDENEIKKNLIDQMVSPVKWSESIINMISIGAKNFTEIGPGKVLCGLIKKINRDVLVDST
tara:strand:- start:2519 stop:3394 length:876 start_codon:yes stop_codon:yes gene_type:complete